MTDDFYITTPIYYVNDYAGTTPIGSVGNSEGGHCCT